MEGKTGDVEFYDKIPTSDWGIGLLFYKNDLLGDTKEINHQYIKITLVLSAFLLILLAIYFNKDFLDEREIWILSVISSFLVVVNIVLIGYLQHTSNQSHSTNKSLPLTDLASLNSFVEQQHARSETLKLPKAIPVPTGIYI